MKQNNKLCFKLCFVGVVSQAFTSTWIYVSYIIHHLQFSILIYWWYDSGIFDLRSLWAYKILKTQEETGTWRRCAGLPCDLAPPRSDVWPVLRDPCWEKSCSQSGHTLSTTKTTISTHRTPPHPTPGLRLKTQHANPACPNRLGDWYSNNDTAFVHPVFLSLIPPYAVRVLQLNPVALV